MKRFYGLLLPCFYLILPGFCSLAMDTVIEGPVEAQEFHDWTEGSGLEDWEIRSLSAHCHFSVLDVMRNTGSFL
ncbi:hypothetical protein SLA2020_094500 [Shorea laevis]